MTKIRLSCCRSALIGGALLAHALVARAQSSSATLPDTLRAATLQRDVAVLRAALLAVHPGVERYNTPAQIDSIFEALRRRFASDQTPTAAFLAISEAMSALRCGHTYLNPVNQSSAVAERVFSHTPRVPFYFRWIQGAMVVTRDASAEHLFPVGTIIESVNAVPARTILARLLPYSRADGHNTAKRIANLSVAPDSRWQAFDIYFALAVPQPEGAWAFTVHAPGTGSRVIHAAPVTAQQRLALYDSLARAGRDTAPPWTFDIDTQGVGRMTMRTWVTYNDKWNWQGWVDRAFDSLAARHARALIIDLRGNEGGTSVGDAILAHLVPRDVVLRQFQRYTRYRDLPDSLRPYLDTWDRSFDHWGAQATPATERPGFYRFVWADDSVKARSGGTPIAARPPRFAGRVFVLVDAANSSATFEFALAARELGVAKLVGAPTGGNQRGITGGAFYFLRLPGSRIEVDVPLIAFFPPAARPDGGIAPDVLAEEQPSDVMAGRDRAMAAAGRLAVRRR